MGRMLQNSNFEGIFYDTILLEKTTEIKMNKKFQLNLKDSTCKKKCEQNLKDILLNGIKYLHKIFQIKRM